MFARMFALLPLALLVSASHLEARDECSNGTINCCNQVQSYQDALPYLIEKGIDLASLNLDVTALLGLGCSPITVIGTGGTSCTQQTACCTGNTYSGLVTAACDPINVTS